jgi:hypothetical protein
MHVVDGYVQGAKVFYDANANSILDAEEAAWSTVTDANGNFSLKGVQLTAQGRFVVMAGGVDAETGNTVGMLMAPGDPSMAVVSPLSLILALNPGLTETELKVALGIDPSVNLKTFDPIAAMAAGDPAAAKAGLALFSAQQQVYSLIQAAASAAGGAGDATALGAAIAGIGQAVKQISQAAPRPSSASWPA